MVLITFEYILDFFKICRESDIEDIEKLEDILSCDYDECIHYKNYDNIKKIINDSSLSKPIFFEGHNNFIISINNIYYCVNKELLIKKSLFFKHLFSFNNNNYHNVEINIENHVVYDVIDYIMNDKLDLNNDNILQYYILCDYFLIDIKKQIFEKLYLNLISYIHEYYINIFIEILKTDIYYDNLKWFFCQKESLHLQMKMKIQNIVFQMTTILMI